MPNICYPFTAAERSTIISFIRKKKRSAPSSSHLSLPLIFSCFLLSNHVFLFCLSSTFPTPISIYVPLNARCVSSPVPQPVFPFFFFVFHHTTNKRRWRICALCLYHKLTALSAFYSHRDVGGFIAVVQLNYLNKAGCTDLFFFFFL